MLVKPSTPSGFRIGPRTPISAPEENADVITPARTRTPVNHATHLQRLLGSLPVGNSKYRNAERPMMIGHSTTLQHCRLSSVTTTVTKFVFELRRAETSTIATKSPCYGRATYPWDLKTLLPRRRAPAAPVLSPTAWCSPPRPRPALRASGGRGPGPGRWQGHRFGGFGGAGVRGRLLRGAPKSTFARVPSPPATLHEPTSHRHRPLGPEAVGPALAPATSLPSGCEGRNTSTRQP